MRGRGALLVAMMAALAALWGLTAPATAEASVGVGVTVGAIRLDEPVQPGAIERLPSTYVVNSGSEPTTYAVTVMGMIAPGRQIADPAWFDLTPSLVHLAASRTVKIEIELAVPANAEPGDYLALVAARPAADASGSSVGITAATKVLFSVAPSNLLWAAYYRARSIFRLYAPWSYVAAGSVLAAMILWWFFSRFSISFGLAKKRRQRPGVDADGGSVSGTSG
jgi:hypothetical protein